MLEPILLTVENKNISSVGHPPNLLVDISSLVIRFRHRTMPVSTDIEKM